AMPHVIAKFLTLLSDDQLTKFPYNDFKAFLANTFNLLSKGVVNKIIQTHPELKPIAAPKIVEHQAFAQTQPKFTIVNSKYLTIKDPWFENTSNRITGTVINNSTAPTISV